ncbi:hypothetical protein PMG71_07165 [Roseofilum sp. BLCC_M154]|uniref:Uncharacterized protein n=1 Tax=Roseofilum acuticapitatum BLCC-M154 TaxID=3022444 RepID=A0ABT7AQL5_9CYAN|nr:hypothetical protein [Roseofilum acuticapitatum]MDJ1169200.1 hypothetical protein [Roseofilum acuticapitatum BLCC-M154]
MIHPDDQYYEPLSPILLATLCDAANGLTNSEICEKYNISQPSPTTRFCRIYFRLGVQMEHPDSGDLIPSPFVRLKAVLKATRIGLIIYDYETSQYVPNPDFKQPDGVPVYYPPRKKKIWTVDSFSDDKVERAKEALLSGEMSPSTIVARVFKANNGESYAAAKQKLALIKEELESQGYTVPKYKHKPKGGKRGANHPWIEEENARIAEIKARKKKEEEHELVPNLWQPNPMF